MTMTDITVIQNVYTHNPKIRDAMICNLSALDALKINYEYVVFNDKGDDSIFSLVSDYVTNNKRVKYVYSDINYGHKHASGG